MLIFVLADCRGESKHGTATPLPPYIHYTPSEESNIHVEFDYPSSWIFREERIPDTDILYLGLGESQLLAVPTKASDEPHGTPSDFGRIRILIRPLTSNQTFITLVKEYKQGHSDNRWATGLGKVHIAINDYPALVVDYQIQPFEGSGYSSVMFERNIFFAVKQQIYHITFTIAEKDRGSEFEKGYEYFFNSLKIVP